MMILAVAFGYAKALMQSAPAGKWPDAMLDGKIAMSSAFVRRLRASKPPPPPK